MVRRKNKGRQKIEMVKMKNESNLQVTFSKRRSGLFKKASELCTLCGAEMVVIVFSPGRKVFSFGHPNVEVVIDRFLNPNPPYPHQRNDIQLHEARRNLLVRDLNNLLTQVLDELEKEKKRNEDIKQTRKDCKRQENWWEEPIQGLNLTQLTEFKSGLEKLRQTVASEASKYLQTTVPRHDFYGGSSSNTAFGISGDNANINTDLDLFNHRRMVSMNSLNFNHNMIGNNANPNDVTEACFVPEYNMNYRTEYNQNHIQNQIQYFKQEHMSEHDHPPHFGHDYY